MGRGGACVPARVAPQGRIHRLSVPLADGNISFVHGSMPFADGNATFADVSTSFSDGNAAARTFGRAHRHRPYHFNTRRRSEKVKTKKLLLAVTLQALKRENIVPALHGDDKT